MFTFNVLVIVLLYCGLGLQVCACVLLWRLNRRWPLPGEKSHAEIQPREEVVRALQAAEEKYRGIFENAVEGIFQSTPEGQYLSVNPALARIYGYDRPDDLIQAVQDIERQLYVEPNRREQFVCLLQEQDVIADFESQVYRHDGRVIWISETARVVRDEQGRVLFYEGTVEDIDERKRSEDLQRQMQAAEAANRAKSEFLANMSHEIRTPLNGVVGMLELLSRTPVDERQSRYIRIARNSADALLALINDILDFSKIEAGRLELEDIDFDLQALVEDTLEMFASRADDAGLELACHVEPEVAGTLRGDPGRLRQVLVNLVSNALKFTPRGEVAVRVSRHEVREGETVVRVAVRDTGIGIPADRMDRLFKVFTQVDASTTRKYGGTGLGLAISYRLVEMMGGQMGVESQVGQGTTFWCHVPLTIRTPAQAFVMPEALAGLRVLIISDNSYCRQTLEQQVGSWQIRVQSVPQDDQALLALETGLQGDRPFGLAILDRRLQSCEALEFVRRLRGHAQLSPLPILLLCGLGDRLDQAELDQLNIRDTLTLPVRQSRLFDCLLAAVNAGPSGSLDRPAATTKPVTQGTVRRRILLAEDNEVNQLVASEMLAQAGYDCRIVATGAEALEVLQREIYDLVLMDCQMPVMDGLEATRRIRQREQTGPIVSGASRRMPIVALTANAIQGDREVCLGAGMDAYVTKPIRPLELLDTIASLLSDLDPSPVSVECSQKPPPAAETPVGTAIDVAALTERCLGNQQLVQRVLREFATRLPQELQQLGEAVEAGNATEAARWAHRLAGAAANLSAGEVHHWARQVEHQAKAGDMTEIHEAWAALQVESERALAQIQPQCETAGCV